MEISRRGLIGGIGAVSAVGAVGFVGASTVDGPSVIGGSDEPDGTGTRDGSDETGVDGDTMYTAVDPDAPFEARLRDVDSSSPLFGASELEHVEGVHSSDEEYVIAIELHEDGRDAIRDEFEERNVAADPDAFVLAWMLDEEVVREVDLDEPTVDALTAPDFGGVVTLPFSTEGTAHAVFEALAAE